MSAQTKEFIESLHEHMDERVMNYVDQLPTVSLGTSEAILLMLVKISDQLDKISYKLEHS